MKNLSYQQVLKLTSVPTPSTAIEGVLALVGTQLVYCDGSNWLNAGASQPGGTSSAIQFNSGTGSGFGGSANFFVDNLDNSMLIKDFASLPSTPVSGMKLFTKKLANRVLPATICSSGMDAALQPATWRQKIGRWNPAGNSATVPSVDGLPALTAQGTVTARNVATTNLFSRTRRIGYVSAATAAAFAGHFSPAAQFTTGDGAGLGGFFYSCRFGFSDAAAVSGARAFVGLSSSVAAPTNVEFNTLTNQIGVAQLSTDATQLYIVYGGSAAQTAIPLGTNFPPMAGAGATNGIMYDLTLFSPPNANAVVYYYLERVGTSFVATGTLSGTAGTTTPANTTLLAHRALRCNNAQLLAVGIDIIGVYFETDY